MRNRNLAVLAIAAAALVSCRSVEVPRTTSQPLAASDAAGGLDWFLERVDDATRAIMNGDRGPWEQVYSHAPDATLFGGWGGYERGWPELAARWQMVSGRYRQATMTSEVLARHVSGDLAVVVQLLRGEAGFADGSAGKIGLRVTHVLRREPGGWQIVHRHADEQMRLQPISTHIQPR